LPDVTRVYETLVPALSRYGDVLIVAPPDAASELHLHLSGLGGDPGRLHIYPADTNDTWTRDYGPVTVETEQGLCLLDYRFNGWGDKFNAELDNAVTSTLYRQGALPGAEHREMDFVLEGGAIETDGKGILMTTTRCLLNPNRNPGLGRDRIEDRLRIDLGVTRIHWIEHGYLEGEAIRCPMHGWMFDLKSGVCVNMEGASTQAYSVEVQDGVLFLSPSTAHSAPSSC